MTKSSSSSFWRPLSIFLTAVVAVQWFLFISILHEKHTSSSSSSSDISVSHHSLLKGRDSFQRRAETSTTTVDSTHQEEEKNDSYEGVAMTVMLQAPKWFHRRFTVMLHNVMANVPPTWPIQIFSNEAWLQKDVLPLHPGLRQLRDHPRLFWTPLPTALTKKKPKEIMKSTWLWDQVVAENVLVFSGNGAFCANSKSTLKDFLDYEYVGVPWGRHGGQGGDGSSHSFRKRSAMRQILKDHPPDETPSEMDMPDFQFFVKYMLLKEDRQHHQPPQRQYKVADKNTTYAFGGVITTTDLEVTAPLVISGTQGHLNWTSRDVLIGVCPELKVIFPSLHEPSCFGAHPNGEKCKATICALQETLPSSGC